MSYPITSSLLSYRHAHLAVAAHTPGREQRAPPDGGIIHRLAGQQQLLEARAHQLQLALPQAQLLGQEVEILRPGLELKGKRGDGLWKELN